METKQQSPGKAADFQTRQLCTDEICKANVLNHNEGPLIFSTSSAVEENLKPQITSTASYNAERESVPECLT